MATQAIPQGLQMNAIRNIPKEWDAGWFRRFVADHLQRADFRNAATAGGIVITGTEQGGGKIGFGGTGAPLTAPIIINRSDGVTAGTTFGANGNVNIAAPSSGDALTASGNATQYSLVANSAGTQVLGLALKTAGSSYSLIVGNSTANAFSIAKFGGLDFLTISSAGNVNIAAPSSGIGLSVNAATGNTALAVNHTRNISNVPVRFQETGFDDVGWEFQRGSSTLIYTVAYNRASGVFANQSHYALSHTFTTGASPTTALTIGSSGNITVAAPSSGVALTVSGVTGQYIADLYGPSGGNGLFIQAASSSANFAFTCSNYLGSALFYVDGGGGIFFPSIATTTTAPGAGGAGALPATPAGYVTFSINGTLRKLPYY